MGSGTYCANESQNTVDAFDTKTLQLVHQIPLSGRLSKAVVSKKNRKIYVAISVRTASPRPGFQAPAGGRSPRLST